MPTKAQIVTEPHDGAAILNTLAKNTFGLEGAPQVYSGDIASLTAFGNYIFSSSDFRNIFVNALLNKIAFTIVSSRSYSNPWARLKSGVLGVGETVEEVYIGLANPESLHLEDHDPDSMMRDQYGYRPPDVKSAWHRVNYGTQYVVSIVNEGLRAAFRSFRELDDFIYRCIDQLSSAEQYDEYLVMKYILYRAYLDGKIRTIKTPEITDKESAESVIMSIKYVSDEMTHMKRRYNAASVLTRTFKENQLMIGSTKFTATTDVTVLANAFNMEKAQFIGNQISIDSFGDEEVARLNDLLKDYPDYSPITEGDMETITSIHAFLIDENFFRIYDQIFSSTVKYIDTRLMWQHYLIVTKIMSASPFANAVVFASTAPENKVTNLTITGYRSGSADGPLSQNWQNLETNGTYWFSARALPSVSEYTYHYTLTSFSGQNKGKSYDLGTGQNVVISSYLGNDTGFTFSGAITCTYEKEGVAIAQAMVNVKVSPGN